MIKKKVDQCDKSEECNESLKIVYAHYNDLVKENIKLRILNKKLVIILPITLFSIFIFFEFVKTI